MVLNGAVRVPALANSINPTFTKDVFWGEATDNEKAHAWLSYTWANEKLNIQPVPPAK